MYYVLCLSIIRVIECIHASPWGKLVFVYWFVSVSCIQQSCCTVWQWHWAESVFRNGILRAAVVWRWHKKSALVAVFALISALILAALVISDDVRRCQCSGPRLRRTIYRKHTQKSSLQNTTRYRAHTSQTANTTFKKYMGFPLVTIFPQIVIYHIKTHTHSPLNQKIIGKNCPPKGPILPPSLRCPSIHPPSITK